jgi:V8-like Glu-specific endopeptidase
MTKILRIYALAAAGALLILYVFSSVQAHAASLETSADATYKLYADGRGICSIQHIKNVDEGALMLTASHCIQGDKDTKYSLHLENRGTSVGPKDVQTLEIRDERVFYLRVLRDDPKGDVALLVTKSKTAGAELGDPIDLATVDEANTVKFGDDLIVLGFPAAAEKTITKGQFTGKINGVLDTQYNYQTNIPVAGGNSGGGLYANFWNPKDGTADWKLIGTTFAKRSDNDIMTYFSVAEAIKEITAGYMKQGETQTPEAPKSTTIDER